MSLEPPSPSLPTSSYLQVMSLLQNISQICPLFFISAIEPFQATITSHLDNCQGLLVSLSASCLAWLPSCHSLASHFSMAALSIILYMVWCGLAPTYLLSPFLTEYTSLQVLELARVLPTSKLIAVLTSPGNTHSLSWITRLSEINFNGTFLEMCSLLLLPPSSLLDKLGTHYLSLLVPCFSFMLRITGYSDKIIDVFIYFMFISPSTVDHMKTGIVSLYSKELTCIPGAWHIVGCQEILWLVLQREM